MPAKNHEATIDGVTAHDQNEPSGPAETALNTTSWLTLMLTRNQVLYKIFRVGSRALLATGLADVKIGGSRVRTRISKLFLPLAVRNIPNPVEIDGRQFFHGGMLSTSIYSYVSKQYEPGTTKLIKDVLKPGDVVYDAGAHIGYFSIIAASIVGPSGHVYAFEASGETARYLCQTIGANELEQVVSVERKAVADIVGELSFSTNATGSTARKIIESDSSSKVLTTTLDAHWQEHCNRPVRLLKIDVEGYELRSLKNATAMLSASPDCVVIFEARTYEENNLNDYLEIKRLLNDHGFDHWYVLRDNAPIEPISHAMVPGSTRYGYLNIAASKHPLM